MRWILEVHVKIEQTIVALHLVNESLPSQQSKGSKLGTSAALSTSLSADTGWGEAMVQEHSDEHFAGEMKFHRVK